MNQLNVVLLTGEVLVFVQSVGANCESWYECFDGSTQPRYISRNEIDFYLCVLI